MPRKCVPTNLTTGPHAGERRPCGKRSCPLPASGGPIPSGSIPAVQRLRMMGGLMFTPRSEGFDPAVRLRERSGIFRERAGKPLSGSEIDEITQNSFLGLSFPFLLRRPPQPGKIGPPARGVTILKKLITRSPQ